MPYETFARRILVTLGICVLVLPLMWILSRVGPSAIKPEERLQNLIPVLPKEVRRALPTFDRDCDRDADCDPPLGCFVRGESRLSMCMDSKCETDMQCPEDMACVPLKTIAGAAMVRLCSLVGERKEGEQCTVLPLLPQEACARGLLCQGRCGRPCRLGDAESCPEGFRCSEGREGPPSCLPTCDDRTCPEGLTCMPRGRGTSTCSRVTGPDCRSESCPEGHWCLILEPPDRPWDLRTECKRMCGGDVLCPEGFFCHQLSCMKSCDPQRPDTCGPGLVCGHYHPEDPLYCIPG